MLIAIPVNEESEKSDVCVSFGRAPFYMIYDTEKRVYEYVVNTAAQAQGGAGIKAAQMIVDSKAKVVLTPRYGENASQVLVNTGISVFKTIEGTADENIDFYLAGKLSSLTDIHPGFHGHGG
jgi:predicted Fe-Mo cluster-binding NifX family protein